ncbi:hypothetical protein AB1Y20_000836 [Prymnesium parvum]|uniref:Lon N-terminal domain-containing protein n=1 Tax=Prymnesium parvum TaxID=97485 RepID=A0AB34K5W7_PRYPA
MAAAWLCLLAWPGVAGLARLPTSRVRLIRMMAGPAGSAAGGGGDLDGGSDAQRNARVEALRQIFAAPSAADAPETESLGGTAHAADAPQPGLLPDLPLCRYSWCLLPHHQVAMSVWQPQYTLMFATLLAQPAPQYYLHVLLPGGADSLGQPGYELEPGSKAALTGTLVRVAYARRNPDSTLTLVVQGLARGVVLRPTQLLPYSRADVQVLPDREALLAAARGYVRRAAAGQSAVRQALAAAWGEAEALFAYEATALSFDAGGRLAPLNQLNASAAATLAHVAESVGRAVARAPAGAEDSVYEGSRVLVDVRRVLEHGAGADDEAALAALEVEVWLAIDALLQSLRVAAQAELPVPIPSQILGLLPPPPEGGWPASFRLASVAAKLSEEYATGASDGDGEGGSARRLSYVPADPRYPMRKRAERLSWVVWALIGDQKVGVNSFAGSPYQVLLEADGTAERFQLALAKMNELKEALR